MPLYGSCESSAKTPAKTLIDLQQAAWWQQVIWGCNFLGKQQPSWTFESGTGICIATSNCNRKQRRSTILGALALMVYRSSYAIYTNTLKRFELRQRRLQTEREVQQGVNLLFFWLCMQVHSQKAPPNLCDPTRLGCKKEHLPTSSNQLIQGARRLRWAMCPACSKDDGISIPCGKSFLNIQKSPKLASKKEWL